MGRLEILLLALKFLCFILLEMNNHAIEINIGKNLENIQRAGGGAVGDWQNRAKVVGGATNREYGEAQILVYE